MKLFRLDAIHDPDDVAGRWAMPAGEFTRFFESEIDAEACERGLRTMGWACEVYQVEFPLDPADRRRAVDRIVAGIWPNLALDDLLCLVDSPLATARQELAELVERARKDKLARKRVAT